VQFSTIERVGLQWSKVLWNLHLQRFSCFLEMALSWFTPQRSLVRIQCRPLVWSSIGERGYKEIVVILFFISGLRRYLLWYLFPHRRYNSRRVSLVPWTPSSIVFLAASPGRPGALSMVVGLERPDAPRHARRPHPACLRCHRRANPVDHLPKVVADMVRLHLPYSLSRTPALWTPINMRRHLRSPQGGCRGFD